MFESDDWIFEAASDDVEEETRRRFYSPCQNEEKTQSVKRRKLDGCKALSLLTNNTFVQKSELNTVANTEANSPPSTNKNSISSRGNLLLGIFQKNTSQETFDFSKEVNKDSSGVQREAQCFQPEVDASSKIFQYKEYREKSRRFMSEVRVDKEVKLIRIFPGPAGLVPDVKNDNISAESYLSSVKELENKAATKRIEIKSQDEKNLFGEKAWKLLLNDLPDNFLQDYGISTVKDKANASHCDSIKIRFIAGVLDYIDHSHDDPFVILKDSTGSIEGTIHRDIPLTYPGILEPHVVVLLRDVGLLKTTTYIVTNKYHILVSLVNLLAIYSNKGRIVSTSLMESISSYTSDIELNRETCMPVSKLVYVSGLQKIDGSQDVPLQSSSFSIDTSIKDPESELADNPLLHLTNRKYESFEQALEQNDKNCKITGTEMFESLDHSVNIDNLDMDDIFFTTDCDFITLEKQNCLNRSLSKTISQTSKLQQCNSQARNTKHLEKMKRESDNIPKKIKEQHLPQTVQKCVMDVKALDTCHSRENCLSSYDGMARRDSNSNVKSTLPTMIRKIENSKTLISYFTNDKYDSDDEILSQLDVDNISGKLKKEC